MILVPIISAILFRLGGCGKDDRFLPFMRPPTPIAAKIWRWGMGLPIALLTGCYWLIPAYFIVTNCMPYGEKSWLNFLGRDGKWITYGLSFGACSFFCLPFGYGLIAALLGGLSFWGLMKWSNDYGLNHAWVEVGFGFLGTIIYLTKGG